MAKTQANGLTGELSQHEIVTLAVFLLGGDQRSIDTEDAAVKAHELAPGRFSWRKYAHQINLELVRVYLSDAKKPEKGALLSGSGRTGWRLTTAGLEWARVARKEIVGKDLSRARADSKSGSIDEQRWRRERDRLQSTVAWTLWKQGDIGVSVSEAEEVFRIDSYAVGTMKETKIMRLRALFDDDDDLGGFIANMASIIRHSEEKK